MGAVGQLHGRADVVLLGNSLLGGLAGGDLQLKAVDVAGRLGQLRGARGLELVPHGELDQHGPALRVAVPDRVGLRLAHLGGVEQPSTALTWVSRPLSAAASGFTSVPTSTA